ncbi:MAG: hypothetical protein JKX97_08065 [Candidatus Lindowbacteria bacterium]|nr:hypothetical protein [Candidatus Lindowbacteria bacterium]
MIKKRFMVPTVFFLAFLVVFGALQIYTLHTEANTQPVVIGEGHFVPSPNVEKIVSYTAKSAPPSTALLQWQPFEQPRIDPDPPEPKKQPSVHVSLIGIVKSENIAQALLRVGNSSEAQIVTVGNYLEGLDGVKIVSIRDDEVRLGLGNNQFTVVGFPSTNVHNKPWLTS